MNKQRVIVITGSTRGIGYGVAAELLKRGHQVVLSGRKPDTLNQAVTNLAASYGENVSGCLCDVTRPADHDALFAFALKTFGQVNIWVNNAGLAHPTVKVWELPQQTVDEVIQTNVLGTIYGCRAAINGMLAQGGGWVYNLEGFGSNGRVRAGMSLYGLTKAATTYLDKSLAKEVAGTAVKIAAIQPGMVITDLVTSQFQSAADLEKVKPIFNIVASRPAEVAPWIADQLLRNQKNGAVLTYLPAWKLIIRFLTAPVVKRNVFD